MPTFDFKCIVCDKVFEKLLMKEPWRRRAMCSCGRWAEKQLSAPAGIRMGDGRARRKAQRITEPTWVYPDGHRESLNSANTRPEEP